MPAQRLLAGACAVDITPINYRDTYLAGFAPGRLATGVLDPIYARALYLDDGVTQVLIITLDLIGLLHPFTEQLRKSVGVVDPENAFICCTHTHSGPDTLGLWGPPVGEVPYYSGIDNKYLTRLIEHVQFAASKAKKRALPAKIGFATDNSRKDDITWNIRQPGFMDHDLNVMRVIREDGGPDIATLVNYGCHPEALWERNTKISPDWPVALHRSVERAFGGVSIFLNGALGAMVTPGIEDDTPLSRRESFYTSYGNKIGKMAVAAGKDVRIENDPVIKTNSSDFKLPLNNKKLAFVAGLGLIKREMGKEGIVSRVGHMSIGGAHFAFLPGEFSPGLGIKLKKRMDGDVKFLAGLANDEIGYVLDKAVFEDPRFEYEISMSMGPETADRIIEKYLELPD